MIDEHPSHEVEEEEQVEVGQDEAVEAAAELGKKLRKLVCAAVCADKRVPLEKAMQDEQPPDFAHITDEEERKLTQLKWKLEQKEQMIRMLEAEDSDKPFEPGPMCFRCARWMRTDKEVMQCRASGRQGAMLVDSMEALLWGERSQSARRLRAPLSGIWRSTFRGLHRVGWLFGPRQWRRDLLQVVPTAREVANTPALRPRPEEDLPSEGEGPPALGALVSAPRYRVFPITPVVNGAPFDGGLLAGTLLVEKGGTAVKGRIKGVGAFMTMTARTAEPMQVHGARLARQTCAMLHYFEVKIVGNIFGMAIGLVAGSVEKLDNWFPDHSLRLEFDGAVRG